MLTKAQVEEIREHLSKAQNPVFFFDNDEDGLCSFLLLQRFIQRGRGVPIKTFPDLSVDYFKKVEEFGADYIFILDKPCVSNDFFLEAQKFNIPVVWIDHHAVDQEILGFVNYYNPLYNEVRTSEPVTALVYQVSNKKEDLWIAVVGCVSDWFIPDFYSEFLKKYRDLGIKTNNAAKILYDSEIGKIARIFSFGLKDKTSNVVNMLRFLINAKSPYEVLEIGGKNYLAYKRFLELERKYERLVEEAKSKANEYEKLIFFKYGGNVSMSSDIANKLLYLFPKQVIIVARIKGNFLSISGRGEGVKGFVLEAIKDLENARGGGHENAIGASVMVEDFEKFKNRLISAVEV
jgi:single-stranded DNA-specific DHH superfamily exonuclease